MRITSTQVISYEEQEVERLGGMFEVEDNEMLLDMFSLILEKGDWGLKDKSEIRRDITAQCPLEERSQTYRRCLKYRRVLVKLVSTKYLAYLCQLGLSDTKKLQRLLAFFRMLNPTIRKSHNQLAGPDDEECSPVDVLTVIAQILKAMDDDVSMAKLLVVDSTGKLQQGTVRSLPGKAKVFDATFTGDPEQRISGCEEFIKGLDARQVRLFMLAENMQSVLDDMVGEESEKSPIPEDDKSVAQVRGIEEAHKALPSQHAMHDSESFVLAAQRGDLVRPEELRQVKKNQFLYFVVDVSGSMSDGYGQTRIGDITCGDLASTIALVFLDKVRREKGTFLLMFFAGAPLMVEVCRQDDDFINIARMLALANYNGNSTRILTALKQAARDIKQQANGVDDATVEICLITDAQDSFCVNDVCDALDEVPLHTLYVGSSAISDQKSKNDILSDPSRHMRADVVLRAVSEKFIIIDPDSPTLEKSIVESVV